MYPQLVDFLARRDDFVVGQAVSPVTAGCSRRFGYALLLRQILSAAAFQAARSGEAVSCPATAGWKPAASQD
jgi:hypothetical protein